MCSAARPRAMRLLSAAFDPGAGGLGLSPAGPLFRVAAAATALLVLGAVVEGMGLSPSGGRALQIAAVHGGLVAGAFALLRPQGRCWRHVGSAVTAALVCAAWLSEATPWGCIAYLLPLVALGWRARRLPGLGWGAGSSAAIQVREVAVGVAVGTVLGAHLLVTATLTLGYTVGIESPLAYVRAVAYDAGANAFSAAWFFHGALFSWLWRRLDFGRATAGATAAALVRYLLDPALPRAVEAAAGSVFYLSVLGIASCALRARAGSAAPTYAATVAFFAAYRSLSAC
jgi:hypothetical protein